MFKNVDSYGQLIDELLKDKSLSKQQLALDMGLGLKTIYNLQNGENPSDVTIQKINNYLKERFGMELKESGKGITVIKSQSINYGKTYSGSTHNETISAFLVESLRGCQEENKKLIEEIIILKVKLAQYEK